MTETYIPIRRRRKLAKSNNSKIANKKNCWVATRVLATAGTATAATVIVSATTAPGPLLKSPTPEQAPATATAPATAATVSATTAPAQGATAKKGEAAIAHQHQEPCLN